MRHSVPKSPQFYVTTPQECPYLDGRVERKLFTALNGPDSKVLNNALSKQGFRRSQNVLYRPSCPDCTACLSARIPVQKFSFSKSERRVLKRNEELKREVKTPWASFEQFSLFKKYVEIFKKYLRKCVGFNKFLTEIQENSTRSFCRSRKHLQFGSQLLVIGTYTKRAVLV